MSRLSSYIFLICLVFIAGCNNISKYDDEDVAAIVRGKEITVGELRFLYPDDKALEYLDGTIKLKLAIQEAKKLNLDVSQELQEMQDTKSKVGIYPAEDNDTANDMRKFEEAQSEKLRMDPDEYSEQHFEVTQEINIYVIAYIEKMLGEYKNDLEYTEQADQLLDDLVEENEDEIQILIK